MLLSGSQCPRKWRKALMLQEATTRDGLHPGCLCHSHCIVPLILTADPLEDTVIMRTIHWFPGQEPNVCISALATLSGYSDHGRQRPLLLNHVCRYNDSSVFVFTPRHSQGQLHDVLLSFCFQSLVNESLITPGDRVLVWGALQMLHLQGHMLVGQWVWDALKLLCLHQKQNLRLCIL